VTALRRHKGRPERVKKLRPTALKFANELGKLKTARTKASMRIRAIEERLLEELDGRERGLLSDGTLLVAKEVERPGYRVVSTSFIQLRRQKVPVKLK
jgi:hypothetical protein